MSCGFMPTVYYSSGTVTITVNYRALPHMCTALCNAALGSVCKIIATTQSVFS